VEEPYERGSAHELPPWTVVEIAVGVVMERLSLGSEDARRYLLDRARSDSRSVMDLAADVVDRGRP
jgi:hypothetical protein